MVLMSFAGLPDAKVMEAIRYPVIAIPACLIDFSECGLRLEFFIGANSYFIRNSDGVIPVTFLNRRLK